MSDYLPQESRSLTKKMNAYLPPEVITLILRRLPVESAVKCTAVCKSWYALIKDPSFISTHLHRAAALQDGLLLLSFIEDSETERYVYGLYRDNDAFEEYKQLFLPFKLSREPVIVGSCNGLICLARVEEDAWNIVLWNPSIHKHFILPEPDLPVACEVYFFHTIGFGFDSVSNDYKVLLILSDGETEDFNDVWLFSLNGRSWKRLTEVSPINCASSIYSFHEVGIKVFVNGVLHYGMLSPMIFAFDISTEKFFVINVPETLAQFENRMSLIKYEESIALVARGNSPGHKELWVMKEYGVDSSWTKVLHSVDENEELNLGKVVQVFDLRKEGKLFLSVRRESRDHEHDCELAVLDLNCHQREHQKQQLKRLGGTNSFHYLFFGSYVESLVLLDKGKEHIVAGAV
ncbi:unnamed protein product [Cuscuta campestris]|uniref:F-box domain-containing protein n=2 Tax=Cuscuta sect. Cleistogrammica TaxID=1824901 RepID=A0A484NJE6_9ASTE|nr:hypothetical protein DM860_012073 [Cuscuta australis]VFR00477.1 unnamed protein product [Cuscuta campestris]